MPKNTHAQEASTGTSGSIEPELIANENSIPESVRKILSERPVIAGPPPKVTTEMEAGEGRYLGSNFSASNENPANSTDSAAKPERAPATANLSSPGVVAPEAEEAHTTADSADGDQRMAEQSAEAPDDDYDSLTVPQLQEELMRRELPHSGKKAELIARLREDDADYEDEDESDDDEEADSNSDDDSFI